MAARFETPEVPTVGTTPQTVMTIGAAEQCQLLSVQAVNRDTAARTLTLKKTGGTITPITLDVVALAPGERKSMMSSPCYGLDSNGEAFTIESDATAATTEPYVHAVGFKVP